MAFDFPTTPAVDDVYTSGGVTYTWDGTMWTTGGGGTSPAGDFLPLTGGAMDGPIDFTTTDQGPDKSMLRAIVGTGTVAEIQFKHEYASYGQLWFYLGDFWALHTARGASVPGINVNGDVSAASVTDRTLLADAELAQFASGEGEERGISYGLVIKHLLKELKDLKCEIAALKKGK
jgi:hypothetical protein